MSHAYAAESYLYSTYGDDPDLADIVELFVDELPDRISTMLTCLDGSDWEGLRRASHQLKGAAGSYGFQPITEMSARLERMVKSREPETEIRQALTDLEELCRKARPGVPTSRP